MMYLFQDGTYNLFSNHIRIYLKIILFQDEIQNEINTIYELCTIFIQNCPTDRESLKILFKSRKKILQIFTLFLEQDFENVVHTNFFQIYQKIFMYFLEEKHKYKYW